MQEKGRVQRFLARFCPQKSLNPCEQSLLKRTRAHSAAEPLCAASNALYGKEWSVTPLLTVSWVLFCVCYLDKTWGGGAGEGYIGR